MSRTKVGSVIAMCLLVAALVGAAARMEVVTNPTPAVSATMELASSSGGVFTWIVSGKVKPSYRGFGATVQLVCQRYDALENGGTAIVYGNPQNVDGCGNFSFSAPFVGTSPQLDNSFFCFFVVHVDGNNSPQACNGRIVTPDAVPDDPNGTAPCSGGLCPDSP